MVPSGASSAAVQAQEADRVAVLLPLPLAGAYDYAVPDALRVGPGDFVIAPLGSRSVIGVVWDAPLGEAGEDSVPRERLREIQERLPAPRMPDALRRFIEWVANYTVAPSGAVLRMATCDAADILRIGDRTGRIARGLEADVVFLTADPAADVMNAARVHAVLNNGRFLPAGDLRGGAE